MYGYYCHVCGQENIEPKQSAWHLVTHFFYDITHFDGKFFTTLKDLLARPGFLSGEFMIGRRAGYLHPIRMYIFTSAIFFIIFFSLFNVKTLTATTNLKVSGKGINEAKYQALSNVKTKKDSMAIEQAFSGMQGLPKALKDSFMTASSNDPVISLGSSDKPYKSIEQYDSVQHKLSPDLRDNWIKRLFAHKQIELNNKYSGDREAFMREWLDTFFHSFPKLLFISLPIFALLLKLLYIRRKQFYYADHGIFAIHLYIYSFIALLFIFGIRYLGQWSGWGWLWIFNTAIILYSLYYFYRAMRNFYQQSGIKTFLKYIILYLLSFITILILFLFFFLLSILEV